MEISHSKPDCKDIQVHTNYIRMRQVSGKRIWLPIGLVCMNCNNSVITKTEYVKILLQREALKAS